MLLDMNTALENFGANQVGDEIWVCGARSYGDDEDHDQSKSCMILSLLDGTWRIFEHKMNLPRLRPGVFSEGTKVIVKGGTTSSIHSNTGCRDTREVSTLTRRTVHF